MKMEATVKNLTRKIYHWHQKLGLLFGLAIIFWGLSGLAHPIISRLNPKPIAFSAPQIPLYEPVTNAIMQPSEILSRYGIESVTRA